MGLATKRQLRITGNTVLVAATVIVAGLLFGGVLEAEEQDWTSAAMPNFSLGEKVVSPYGAPGNRDCLTTSFQTLVLQTAQSTSPTEKTMTACTTQNALGAFGGGYVIPNTHYGYKAQAVGQSPNLVGVPSQSRFLWLDASGGQSGQSVYILDSIVANGTFTLENSNYYRGYIYNLKNIPRTPLKDSAGQPIRINEYAFSKNGEWMFAEVLGIGFVRINILTGNMTLFSDTTFQYGQASLTIAISDDGKYAISSGWGTNGAQLYDLNGCSASSAFNVNSRAATGCKTKSLQSYIGSKVSGFRFLHSMRFEPGGRTIRGVADRMENNVGQKYKFTLSLDAIQPETKTGYMALGDSFASGEGDNGGNIWYESGTDEDENMCHLSKRSYPYLIARDLQISEFHSVACSGAKQEHINNSDQFPLSANALWIPGVKKQTDYIPRTSPPDFITIAIGGNDLDFAGILMNCIIEPMCVEAGTEVGRSTSATKIAEQYTDLRNTYKQLVETTQRQTRIYVIGYPEFVQSSGGNCGVNVHLNDQEREFIGQSVRYTNQIIKAAAEAEGVTYIDAQDALAGKNLCSGALKTQMAVNGITEGDDKQVPWYVGALAGLAGGAPGASAGAVLTQTFGLSNNSFHPNQNGHVLLEERILGQTGADLKNFTRCASPSQIICPDGKNTIPLPDQNYFGPNATTWVNSINNGDRSLPSLTAEEKLILRENLSDQLKVDTTIDNLKPGSTVRFEKHSTPVDLGTFTVDNNGELHATLSLGGSNDPGFHTVHAYGTNIAGEPVEYYQKIYITGPSGDINSNGVPDTQDKCGFVPAANVDEDKDGIDDACDGFIDEVPPAKVIVIKDPVPQPKFEQSPAAEQPETDKAGLQESSPETSEAVSVSSPDTVPAPTIQVSSTQTNRYVAPQAPMSAQDGKTSEPPTVLGESTTPKNNRPTPKVATASTTKSNLSLPTKLGILATAVLFVGLSVRKWRSLVYNRINV